jgi:hypothetical protein
MPRGSSKARVNQHIQGERHEIHEIEELVYGFIFENETL